MPDWADRGPVDFSRLLQFSFKAHVGDLPCFDPMFVDEACRLDVVAAVFRDLLMFTVPPPLNRFDPGSCFLNSASGAGYGVEPNAVADLFLQADH